MIDKNAPVGVFDSGVGGLTVAREIMRNLPSEKIVYFGDTARVPYGSKSKDTVIRYSSQIVHFLREQNVKAIVIACNTASAFALEAVQDKLDIPVLGVIEAGARVAAEETKNKRVGVIGTVGTVGVVDIDPGSINVVPGEVTLWVDVRGVDNASIARTLQAISEAAESVAAADGVDVSTELLTADKPVALDDALAAQSEAICVEKGFSFLHMNSGAGHDAMHMTKICPTTMLFVPCRAGISHNPAEYASNEDICRGIEVLAEVLRREATPRCRRSRG